VLACRLDEFTNYKSDKTVSTYKNPNYKHQIPNKSPIPISNDQNI